MLAVVVEPARARNGSRPDRVSSAAVCAAALSPLASGASPHCPRWAAPHPGVW